MKTMLKTLAAAATIALLPILATTAPGSAQSLNPGAAACDSPNVSAATISAAEPEMPAIATGMDLSGTTLVKVAIDAAGNILDTSVAKSSGAFVLDRAALVAAHNSTFRPEIRNCTPVPGTYLFVVDFAR